MLRRNVWRRESSGRWMNYCGLAHFDVSQSCASQDKMAQADQWLESHKMPPDVRHRILSYYESAYFVSSRTPDSCRAVAFLQRFSP